VQRSSRAFWQRRDDAPTRENLALGSSRRRWHSPCIEPGCLFIADGNPAGTVTYRVLYHSTSLQGSDVAQSGMVIVPGGPEPQGGYPVLSWAHGTTGVADICAPSAGGNQSVPYLNRFLAAGFVVAATDYDGLGTPGIHPYLVGVSEGRSVLDAARAARNLVGAAASTRVLIFGHSQGGHAALFAGQLASTYAKDLQIKGVVAAAPVGSLTDLLPASPPAQELPSQPYAAMAAIVWSEIYPDIRLNEVLTPAGADLQGIVTEKCSPATATAASTFSADQLFQASWSTAAGMSAAIAENSPGSNPLPMPVLLVQGLGDEIVTPASTDAVDARLCEHHDQVQYNSYPGNGHSSVLLEAEGDIVRWIDDRFAEQRAPSNCGSAPALR